MRLPRFARARAERLVEAPGKLADVLGKAARKLAGAAGKNPLKPLVEDFRAMLGLGKAWARGEYRGIETGDLVLLVGAVVYFLMPLDLVPDFVPISGFLDDAAVITFVVGRIKAELEKFRAWQARQEKREDET